MKSRIEPAIAKENVPNERVESDWVCSVEGAYEPLAIVNDSR